ncbi:MAG: hypothetical protein HXS44_08690 [Theionarchaea archaeon]|nr:hypothetical protein [Theionarchaea archaeon]
MKLEELDITGWGVEGWAFGIDPETYIQKAQKYWEQQEYEKSQEYFHKAKEWCAEKGDLHKVALCEKFIEIMTDEIQEYSQIFESLEEAESFYLSMQLFEMANHEKGINECLQRIEYFQGISEEEENHSLSHTQEVVSEKEKRLEEGEDGICLGSVFISLTLIGGLTCLKK